MNVSKNKNQMTERHYETLPNLTINNIPKNKQKQLPEIFCEERCS